MEIMLIPLCYEIFESNIKYQIMCVTKRALNADTLICVIQIFHLQLTRFSFNVYIRLSSLF